MNINSVIAKTYIVSNKKLTAVAVLGVVLGMSIYIFMNSMMVGFDKSSYASIFKTTSHIRVYKDDEISKPLTLGQSATPIIINPKVVPVNNTIINPNLVIETILKQPEVTVVTPQVNSNVFYNNGKSQISGIAVGIKPDEANLMYNIKSFMVEGNFELLKSNPNGIVIGSGIAAKMNLAVNDNLSLTSSKGVNRTFKVIGIFKTNNSNTDKTKSYINISASQQLLKEGTSYITDINVNITDPENAEAVAQKLEALCGYKAEGWKQANETLMAANKMRKMIITFVSLTILLVAGFGIYNILNMTVSQKINDIAILKATGFSGSDVKRIFIYQAMFIGIVGGIIGLGMGGILSFLISKAPFETEAIPTVKTFPVNFQPLFYVIGAVFAIVTTFFAGYLPARKASKIDPVVIIRGK